MGEDDRNGKITTLNHTLSATPPPKPLCLTELQFCLSQDFKIQMMMLQKKSTFLTVEPSNPRWDGSKIASETTLLILFF